MVQHTAYIVKSSPRAGREKIVGADVCDPCGERGTRPPCHRCLSRLAIGKSGPGCRLKSRSRFASKRAERPTQTPTYDFRSADHLRAIVGTSRGLSRRYTAFCCQSSTCAHFFVPNRLFSHASNADSTRDTVDRRPDCCPHSRHARPDGPAPLRGR